MSRDVMNFVDLCMRGEALADEIDNYVDVWHEGGTGVSLPEFLGLTRDEYALWVERPEALNFVLDTRRRNRSLEDVHSTSEAYELAVLSLAPQEAESLVGWLKQTGRVTD